MKRNLLHAGALAVAMFVTDAHAIYTRCEIRYGTETLGLFVAEVGNGRGTATCWDGWGNEYQSRFSMAVVGPAARLGVCKTHGRISTYGGGIDFSDIITAMGDFDFGPHIGRGNGVGAGVRLNIGGAAAYASELNYSGPCMGLGSFKFRFNASIPKLQPTGRRSNPPPMPPQYDRDQRRQRAPAPAVAGPARPATRPAAPPVVQEGDEGVIVDRVMR